MTKMVYSAACAICPWRQVRPTQAGADAVAVQHEQANAGHVAYVLRPDTTQEAA